MGYGIMRFSKQTKGNVSGLQREHERSIDDAIRYKQGLIFKGSDIDFNRTNDNVFLKRAGNHIVQELSDRVKELGCRVRKDSTFTYDAIYTMSPESMNQMTKEQQLGFFKECYEFHKKHLADNNEDNMLSAVIHYDETTPHMHVISTPVVQNENGTFSLSAKKVEHNGSKGFYREMQDCFHAEVSRKYGLERGNITQSMTEKKQHLETLDFKARELNKRVTQLESTSKALEMAVRQKKDSLGVFDRLEAFKPFKSLTEWYNDMLNSLRTFTKGFGRNKTVSEYVLPAEQAEKLRSAIAYADNIKDIDARVTKLEDEFETTKRVLSVEQSDNQHLRQRNKELRQENKLLKDKYEPQLEQQEIRRHMHFSR